MKNGVNERKFASSAVLARICFLLKRNCVYGQIIIVMRFCISLIVYYESEFPFLDFCAILQCVLVRSVLQSESLEQTNKHISQMKLFDLNIFVQ